MDHQPVAVQLDRPGLEQRTPQLADEERVALGEVVDRGGERPQRVVGAGAGSAPDELGHLLPGQPRQPYVDDVVPAQFGERLGELAGHVGVGVAVGGQHDKAARGGAREVSQQQQGRGICPVDVLEDQERWAVDARE